VAETHEAYEPPPPDSQYCYRRGKLRFTNVAQVTWSDRGRLPATDATGEQDFGNIDQFWLEGSYFLEGHWGRMTILADNPPTIEWIDTTP